MTAVANGQEDIIGITDSQRNVLITYYYDAWGATTSIYNPDSTYGLTLATINPLRYRGYVFDWENGIYYLQSRYYIPEIGRFLNADNYPSTAQGLIGCNMFSYCENNPVCRQDYSGEFFGRTLLGALAGAVFAAVSETVSQVVNHVVTGEKIDGAAILTSAAGGAVYGGVIAATGSETFANAASAATTSVINGVRNDDSLKKIVSDTVKNTTTATVISVVPKMVNKSLSGKYLKLNKVEKMIKKMTDGPYQGKYASGPNYLADSCYYSYKNAIKKVATSPIKALGKLYSTVS